MSFSLFAPAKHKPLLPEKEIDQTYKKLRLQVFAGIFLGYAGYYLVRKNFSMAMPELIEQGFSKGDLGFALSGVSIAYGLSKFLMGNISDRSNARLFLPAGLALSALCMIIMGVFPFATSSIAIMFVLLFINGWFQGMGWPPCGRVVVHWFSQKERGLKMSVWNIAHNVGGGLVGPMAILGLMIFGAWQSNFYFPGIVALVIAVIAYALVRDTPQSCGLPPIEVYKNEKPADYQPSQEQELSAKRIFIDHVFFNRALWYIAFANIFVYLVRYGVLDWAPTYLKEAKGFSLSESGWAYFAYEYAGIPGTIICGWLSDKVFKGRRAPATIIYMVLVFIAVLVYWKNPPGHILIDNIALITIGFLIYGPVMLIGVQALDLVPKKAAGTAAGFTGLFGYLGGAVFANIAIGHVVDKWGWDGGFIVLSSACLLAIVFTAFTWKRELSSIKQ
ncbi:OPA family glycerol-3-phosphate transporter-like MFS transporter [Arcticibacter tournemirensis]|uniref:Glycerol-3-phosphate transporter n=1 Tax=Arcticibacter tournemirensis TaxID=699437 RepID=A0A4Q0MAI7_9SPHI|nr:glycerol-3-phosphate transporter [Arcticibacter tournemirensis]KAA8484370.1 glycerol-3-phosphate transporter [Arcticibacter tournemirensis]RXF69819.1 glycerol-3-phosphate transporter [Arcticibacter tournemirensis]TQM49810.1 OPA family glycerol-3-phosphate transporter-like MFS transporter [Arcticibacter tournemirensis]